MRLSVIPSMIAVSMIPGAASATSYSASVTTAPNGRLIARDVLWTCAAGTCSGATDYSRPLIVCQSLVRKAGPVAGFLADGRALGADELARCNASAKPSPDTARGDN